ncbi:hypothetical protein Tco_0926886 [Tanacetum coccineum]|uniref:Uncharacterized protein n=1 Tax=Tanacetum coccineum TaxID=301880 RepID=A0ABQ5DDQ8_9ASTR
MCSRGLEMLRVLSLPHHRLIKYDFNTLERATYADITNSSNLLAAGNELLRTVAEKEDMISVLKGAPLRRQGVVKA